MFNRFGKLGVFLAALMLLEGCATTQQSTVAGSGATVADTRLQADVMRTISMYESAAGGSPSPRLISVENVGKEGATYIERWTIDSNGRNVTYSGKLTPSPRGGVDYAIARLPQNQKKMP